MNHLAWKKTANQEGPFAPGPDHPGVSPSDTPLDDATHVIWQDPTAYNPFFHGPPYLPGMHVRLDKKASVQDLRTFVARMAAQEGHGLPSLLALLRALTVIHQSHHWLTYGPTYYSDHLLFERLYNETVGEVDQVAEKAVGIGCPKTLIHPGVQASAVSVLVSKFCGGGVYTGEGENPQSYVGSSLQAEQYFLASAKRVADTMKGLGELSRGTDNLIAGIEDLHEGHVYLLSQRLQGDPWKSSA
jgi:DNA-binding ferritin-like protein